MYFKIYNQDYLYANTTMAGKAFYVFNIITYAWLMTYWRRERDSNPRTALPPSSDFESDAFNRSAISPCSTFSLINIDIKNNIELA